METHCYAGLAITPFYDPLLAKLIVKGENRTDAVAKMQAALYEFKIDGIPTNLPFLRRLTAHPEFIQGDLDTSYVSRFLEEGLEG